MAAEPAEPFLRALQSRGYDELALAYLERLEQRQIGGQAFLDRIAYEQGDALIRAALQQRVLGRKQAYLNRAQAEFAQFVAQQPNHPLKLAAQGKQGTIQLERARILVTQADTAAQTAEQREQWRGEARQLFAEAATIYQQNLAAIRERLVAIPQSLSPDTDAALITERDRLRTDYVQAMFVSAMVLYEQAQSYDGADLARGEHLRRAEAAFGEVAKKYRKRIAGLSAVLFQGRCWQQLGDPRKALAHYEDLLTLEASEAAVRPVLVRALRGAMECWLSSEIQQPETARQQAEVWLEKQRPDERTDQDWLTVRYLLATAYMRLAAEGEGRDRAALRGEARKLAIEVAKYRSDSQTAAQQLLAELGLAESPDAAASPAAKTWGDALAAAREQLTQRQTVMQTIAVLEQRLAEAGAEQDRTSVQAELAEAQQRLGETDALARRYLEQAQALEDDETEQGQRNELRYYLSMLSFYQGEYYAALVRADFLAARYPSSEEGRRAAALSLAALGKLYGDGSSSAAPSLRRRMVRIAERIAAQWKGQPEADDALATLVSLAVVEGRSSEAVAYLERMSADSPRRAAAELAAGQSLWSLASRGLDGPDPSDSVAARQTQAIAMMTEGIRRGGANRLDASTVNAILLVVQHRLNTADYPAALALLTDPDVGPLTLLDAGHPLLAQPALQQRVRLIGIMTLIGSLPSAAEPQTQLDKASQILESLQQAASETGQQQQLNTAYVMLARNLQQQIVTADPQRRSALVAAFEQFLGHAASSAKELSVLNWVAEAYIGLGQATRGAGNPPSAQSAEFFGQAVAMYRQILRRVDAGEFTMTQADHVMLETRLASAYREQGNFDAAVDAMAKILARENSQVFVQMEAAKTLQAWGMAGNVKAFELAIQGDRLDPQTQRNLVWGYGRIAKAVAAKPQLSDLFFAARLAIAQCRFQQAVQGTAAERNDRLQQAERDILLTARLYPQLGGEQHRKAFAELLQEIQTSLGKKGTGLP